MTFVDKLEDLICHKLAKLLGMRKFLTRTDCELKNKTSEQSADKTEMQNVSTKYLKESIHEENEIKYKFAAIVLDRFFFFLSILYFIITFISLILAIPNLY